MLEDDFVVFSTFSSHWSGGVSPLVGHSLNAIVNLVFADDGGRLVKSFQFRVAAVYAPNCIRK